MFNYTAMGVGNHDFDDGPGGLLPFVQGCDFPVLGANLKLENFPELNEYIENSTIGMMCYHINYGIVYMYVFENFIQNFLQILRFTDHFC